MILQTKILPYILNIISLLENTGIFRQFKIHFHIGIKLMTKLTYQSTFPNLTGTTDYKWFVWGSFTPLT